MSDPDDPDDDTDFAAIAQRLIARARPESDAERARREAEREAAARRELRERVRSSLAQGHFPARQVDAALLILDGGDVVETRALARVRQFLDADLAAGRTMLVLSGGVGAGKSTAATFAVAARRPRNPVFLRAATVEASGRYDREIRSQWEGASALVLDDLGAEYADAKGNFLSELDEILDWFYADRRPLIVTTNLDQAAFRARYGGEHGRIVSRIRECGAWAACGGVDLRRPR